MRNIPTSTLHENNPRGKDAIGRLLPMVLSATALGLLTTLSAVVIELSSTLLADMRHGVCVQRVPGDGRPLWQAAFEGSWRPYDRLRCCGGSLLVDHAAQRCRAPSIIQHVARKRFASPLHSVVAFGRPLVNEHSLAELQLSLSDERVPAAGVGESNGTIAAPTAHAGDKHGDVNHSFAMPHLSELELKGTNALSQAKLRVLLGVDGMVSSHAARAARVERDVGNDASKVRSHMSHLFAPDPTESWAEENRARHHVTSLSVEEASVNDDVVQTFSTSAGSLVPYNEWVPWETALGGVHGRLVAMSIYVAGSGLLAAIAALITLNHSGARGSGIPEVKARVGGCVLPVSFRPDTLFAKILALSFCVGAGLAVGKEGPLIHIGACWGVLLAGPIVRLRPWPAKPGQAPSADIEFICAGAAAGVAAAFGAPLAGVLFTVEELGGMMASGIQHSTMLRAFSAAAVAALALKWLDLARTQRLTLFEVDYKQVWAPWEALPFCMLGALGGLVGGFFVLLNRAIHRRRLASKEAGRFTWFLPGSLDRFAQRQVRRPLGTEGWVLEVAMLAVFTALSNYPHALTRMLQNDAISALFAQCPSTSPAGGAEAATSTVTMTTRELEKGGAHHDPLGLCIMGEDAKGTVMLLVGAAALRVLQTSITFGALVPAGLFVPSLYIGACLGRVVGVLVKHYGGILALSTAVVEPGIYAMVGAGAMLAGVSRLTVSLAVVLVELTGGLTYVVPFMLAVLIAKWVGDLMTDGQSVYDVHAAFNGIPSSPSAVPARSS